MSEIRLSVAENILSDPARVTTQMYENFLDEAGRGWVSEDGRQILGFCYADKVNASIWALFVRPGFEGYGFGKLLLQQAVAWLFEIGHESVHLTTGVNTRADRFYSEQGWTRTPLSSTEVRYSLARPRTVR
jgi:GNAT superfamily N-acetyltransferase